MNTNIPIKSIVILVVVLLAIWIPFWYKLITLTDALIITVSTIVGGLAGSYILEKARNNR